MKPIPFQSIDWNSIQATEHPGETGMAYWKTIDYGGLRIRMVEYSAGYQANHWCKLGHILLCVKGELVSELADGSVHILKEGMSYHVTDNISNHRSRTQNGASLFIVDGEFLSDTANS